MSEQPKITHPTERDECLYKMFHHRFTYDNGVLRWKTLNKKDMKNSIGSIVGVKHDDAGYLSVTVDSDTFLVHRVIFCMFHGYMPFFVDHKDTNPENNKIENLRESDFFTNGQNRNRYRNNKTGFKGVHYNTKEKMFLCVVKCRKKVVYRKSFSDVEVAAYAYNINALKHHGEFARINEWDMFTRPIEELKTEYEARPERLPPISRRKGEHWNFYEELYVLWCSNGMPACKKFEKIAVNAGYKRTSSFLAMVERFKKDSLA